MAGIDNLTPVRSVEKARELGSKGGIASGKAKRRKKMIKEIIQTFFEMKAPDVLAKKFAK